MTPVQVRDGVTIYNADCLDILPTLEAGSVHAVIADPPYGTTNCAWDSVIPFEPMWAGIKRAIKRNAAVVLFGSQPFTSALIMSNPKWFKYEWVWDKKLPSGYLNAKVMPLQRHESILVFGTARITYIPQMRTGLLRVKGFTTPGDTSDNYGDHSRTSSFNNQYFPTSIIEIGNTNRTEKVHSTQKPVALLEYLILTYTNPGDLVLDFTMGSGSTGEACIRTGRRFIGIEKEADYFAIAQDRLANAKTPLFTSQPASVADVDPEQLPLAV